MAKYNTYKDSGIEWIGKIPEHWESLQIKHLAIGDNTLFLDGDWIESKEIIYDNGEYRYITTGNIGEGKYKEQGNTYITQETFEKLNCTEVLSNDLLISRLNPPIGRSCLVPDLENKIVTSVDNVILRPSPKYIKNYLVHFFTNTNYFEYTSLVGRGATMQRISRSMLGDIKIAVPPTPLEQTAIANYLDRKTDQIDELIADKKRLLELYEEEKTAIINQAVTKGLDPNVPMKDSGIEWLGKIPENWEVKRLKYVAFFQRGHDLSSTSFVDGDIPVYGSNGIIGYHNKNTGFGPSLVVGRSGSVGEVNFVKEPLFWAHNTSLFLLKDNGNDIQFLYSLLKKLDLKSYAAGTAVGSLNRNNIHEIKVAMPPLPEQKNIVHHIKTECTRIDAKKSKTKKLIDLLTEYRTALISEVVTGKIKVTE